MSSSNCYSSLYPFPFDLNEDDQHQQQHHLFALKSQPSSSSSSSSLTCPTFFNPTVQNQAGSFREPHEFQDQQDQAKIYVPQDGQLGSGDHHHEDSSYKWMPSKMRILRKMMSSERSDLSKSSTATKIEDWKVQINQPSSSPDNSSNSSYNNNNTTNIPIRVCSDCNTTKTPLWRSGPRGPKSLCNACGIRQRKARRAMAAAAAAASNGTIVAAETTTCKKSKVQNKAKLKNNKKCRLNSQSQARKKLCFEDLRVILSKNSAFHRVFPQDEKEAAILLMALSYGLVHG
ncbi:hypothetical protein HRI_004404200 [Hibiscus trionum]|uniref:GATA-type domain-containing protein n=1 Tax=Hibiscus trionum TaxID=183268 RepID=A0A9W7J4N7_HIBTR|nr:hypothetical protein HRI_004404200 [Hibiscus trionum]